MRLSFHWARALLCLASILVLTQASGAYSVLTHEQVVDLLWVDRIQPMVVARFPGLTDKEIREAHAYAYGGSLVQDMRRLQFYASRFPLVEVDATYYALPAEQTAASWAARTPAGFTFNVKAFSLFTEHPTRIAALPADLRPAAQQAGKDPVYLRQVDPAVADQAWDRFLAALEPLRRAAKLGAILLQFPRWFPISRASKDYILSCARRVAPDQVCIEFRNRTWMTPDNQQETLKFLADHDLPYVSVDMPQGYPDSIPPVLAATADLAVIRLHGHSPKWDEQGHPRAVRVPLQRRRAVRMGAADQRTGWPC